MTINLETIHNVFTLFSRVFKAGDELFMFGEDGGGLLGRSDQVLRPTVDYFTLVPLNEKLVVLRFFMHGYNASIAGYAATDKNLAICLDMKFKQEHIDPDAWDWAPLDMQGSDHVTLLLDIDKLLC